MTSAPASTYANLAIIPTPDKDTPSLPLHIITHDKADAWLAAQPAHYRAFIAATNPTSNLASNPSGNLTAGTSSALFAPDGTQQAAFLITSDEPIWQAASAAKSLPAHLYHIITDEPDFAPDEALISDVYFGFLMANYHPHLLDDTPKEPAPKSATLSLAGLDLTRINALAAGTYLCRDLINAPANMMTPAALAQEAKSLAQAHAAQITITTGTELATHFPAIHIVGRAAEIQPCLIDLRWGDTGPLISLVGKGVTFDSGGLDLKPSKAMEMMKKDMGGSAHVLGLAKAIMLANLPVRLRVIIGAAENAISEKAMRPMDVINTRKGLKVEVGNTDAEGRLVLADALDLACEEAPDFLVDFATLTGAARVALGTSCPALFCNHDDTARAIMDAGKKEHDPIWQLPLFEPYDSQLETGHMALSSTGQSGFGGAITAALFLRRFTGKQINWAHIDVMAWNLSSKPGRPRGGEAMGMRAIFSYIEGMLAKG